MLADAATAPRLVSLNGNGFDLPVIRYRYLYHGIAAPAFYQLDGDWKWNNYQNRFHDMHVDLMDVLSGYGASRWMGLGDLSGLLDLPAKSFIEDDIWLHILRGEERLVAEYCKLDVLDTLLLYLVWAHHCGRLEEERLRGFVETIRGALQLEGGSRWLEVAEALEGWPRWGRGGS